MSTGVTPAQFINKWSQVDLPERAASQEHFIDLCRLLGQPTPAEQDATGAEYTFEKCVAVTGPASVGAKGERGFVDAWWRGKFGWEYKRKGKYKTLEEAYRQLCQYREALENPPLLIVSDIARTQIHTNFTGTRKEIHCIDLQHLAHPDNLAKLRRVFADPLSFKPTLSTYRLTENAAAEFAKIADQLRQRNHDPHDAAHFLMKCMFCLFAEDVKLLPERVFTKLLERGIKEPDKLPARLNQLFASMRDGGDFGTEVIKHFNGGLFDDVPAIPLQSIDIQAMLVAAQFDWGAVEPTIFGTLFERSLDPSKRSQIGAHYTSREDIMLIVEPVVMAPLRRQWQAVKHDVEEQLARRRKAATAATKKRADTSIAKVVEGFLDHLAALRILDPACGSGNFLYVAIQELLALEKEVIVYVSQPHIGLSLFPRVRPTQLHGLEINPYAAELAQVVIWIGYLQWLRDNGFVDPNPPILDPLQTIECRDAILKWTDKRGAPLAAWKKSAICAGPADWPTADFIIGNPPFLGSKLFRQYGLEEDYIAAMYANFDIPNTSDLCCYWFELARRAVVAGAVGFSPRGNSSGAAGFSPRGNSSGAVGFSPRGNSSGAVGFSPRGDSARHECRGSVRAGLLATQGIRGGDNRTVLERIKETGDIFMAWSDRDWILDGANVHVSMVGFDNGKETERKLDGQPVPRINANLTSSIDITAARLLSQNQNIAYMGTTKGGAFDLEWEQVRRLLASPNPTAAANSEVIVPWINGSDITKRQRAMWIIDFGVDTPQTKAACYEAPFEYVRKGVFPERRQNRRAAYAENWWIHVEPRPALRAALVSLVRFIVTTRVAKHRVFAWFSLPTLPDSATFAFARSDDYFFGVLHSSIHELWSLRMGTQLEDRPRYTPTTCFETFPLPWPPGSEPQPALEPRPSGRAEPPRDVNVAAPEPRPSGRAEPPRDVNVAAPEPRASGRAEPPRDVNVAAPEPRASGRAVITPDDTAAVDLAFGATYLLTWTTYGSWLPGDERGFVSRVPDGAGGHVIHNAPGEPYDADDAHLRDAARARMKGPPVALDAGAAEICQTAFKEVADRYNIGIHAAAIMHTHVHLVVTAAEADPTRLLNLFKGVSSRRLGQAFGARPGGSWWTRGGSYRSLMTERAVGDATRYVQDQPASLVVFDHCPEPRPSGRAERPRDVNVTAPEPRPSGRAERPRDVNVAAPAYARIADAARELNEQRERWLNPPEWIEDWGRLIDARDKFDDVARVSGEEARRLIRHSAIMAEAARDPRFKKRTLTHLYNERPTWLKLAHEKLDRAVLAAYAAVDPEGGWSEDWATVWTETGAGQPASEPLEHASPAERTAAAEAAARRKEVDQHVLANLLRLNQARAAGS